MVSNFAAEGILSPHAAQISTEAMFQRLLALSSDSTEVKVEVAWIFANLANDVKVMHYTQKYIWYKYHSQLMDFCFDVLNEISSTHQTEPMRDVGDKAVLLLEIDRQLVVPTLELLDALVDMVYDMPNKEMVLRNCVESGLPEILNDSVFSSFDRIKNISTKITNYIQ